MKLLLLTDGIPPYIMGGMQRHTFNLVKYLVLAGVEVKLIHCYNEGEKAFSPAEVSQEIFGKKDQAGFQSLMLEFPKPGKIPGHYIRRSYAYSKRVFAQVEKEVDQYDFVYIKGFAGWRLLEKKKQFTVKMGVNFHGYEMFQVFPDLKTKIKNQILIQPVRKNLNKADFVFSYGGGITILLRKIEIEKAKIVAINGAIDSNWFQKIEVHAPKDPIRLLFVGRFERRKGIEELHVALQELSKDQKFQMSFVGPIPKEVQIKDPGVSYLGAVTSVEEIKKIYADHDVLIAPSYSEGMPNVIMEAMSQGLAILATDVGATSLLVDESNGWLMNEMNLDTLKTTLNSVLNTGQDEIRKKKQQSIERLDERFSWPLVAQKHIDFLKSIQNPKS